MNALPSRIVFSNSDDATMLPVSHRPADQFCSHSEVKALAIDGKSPLGTMHKSASKSMVIAGKRDTDQERV
jgi:hypothetical protein